MGYTHFDKISTTSGYAVGTSTAGETLLIGASGDVKSSVSTILAAASTAAVYGYLAAPAAGTVSGYATYSVSAGTGRAVTVTVGSAGAILLQTGAVAASGTQGKAVTMSNTSGTTTVSAGQTMKIALASCATAQITVGVTLIFTPSA